MTSFNESIRDFLTDSIVVGDQLLPTHYPEFERLGDFQIGFRTHGHTSESLVSDENGAWQTGWYVIALTGLDDPIFIDADEGAIGYPVYSAVHGTGRWDALQIAPNLKAFGRVLEALAVRHADVTQSERIIMEETGPLNAYWREVLEGRQEDTTSENALADPGDFDPSDFEKNDLIVTDIGPQKLQVVRLVSKCRGLPLKDALELAKAAEFEVGSGFKVHLQRLSNQFESLGATVELRAARL